MRETFVYVIAAEGDNHIKIGIAYEPEKRLRQIQGGNPCFLYIARQWGPMSRQSAEAMEARLHHFFDAFRIRGEWFFSITPDQVSELVVIALNASGDEYRAAQEQIFDRVVHG